MKHILYFILATFLFSCGSDDDNITPITPPQRTIIAYLCGDNNLSSEVDMKIDALQQGMQNIGKTDNHLIVYADYNDKMPVLMEITNTNIIILEEYTEKNSASPANFRNILEKAMRDFPAQSYGLICFSHSSGWLPKGALSNPTGFFASHSSSSQFVTQSIFDDNGEEMPISDFANAIPTLLNGEKFEFIVFETCYMAGVEVAYELRNKTKYIVSTAAEMLSNGLVEIYPTQLSQLFAPVPNLKTFAQAYFSYWNSLSGTSRSATISLINTLEMDNLAATIKQIDKNQTINVDAIQHFNRNVHHLFFDLSDYIQTIATTQQFNNYQNVLYKVVEYQAATPQFMVGYPYFFTISKHCGFTTYIKQTQFPNLNNEYDKLSWAKAIEN
jgi:Clostripain family.